MESALTTYIIPVAAIFIASIAFTIFYNVKRSSILLCAIGGALGIAIYLVIFTNLDHKFVAFFAAAASVTLYAEIVGRIKNVPVTIFLTISLIPLVPGKAIFNTIQSLLNIDKQGFADWGLETFLTVLAIALGVIFISSFIRLFIKIREKNIKKRHFKILQNLSKK